jgi:hypothetical protein
MYNGDMKPKVTKQGKKIVLEAVVTAPPSSAEQTVWVEMTVDAAAALAHELMRLYYASQST